MRISASDIDTASVDAALGTTRAVRLRLDLEREVDQQIILDCIDVAEQAPTGGNQGSRRWIVIRDQATKERMAELYMAGAGRWMVETRERLAGTGHHNERVMASAAHLAENLARVPAIVIPTIIGRHDNSGKPGLFDSVIQSAWSFAVALRARGLGTAWVTAILNAEDELAELLGIPETMTPIVMLPVAWTKGDEFGTAPRYPARDITYVDRFSRTYEHGPSDPPVLADGPGLVVERDVKAPLGRIWELVTDIELSARHSDELVGAEWAEGSTGPAAGAQFLGHNKIGDREWSVPCHVIDYDERSRFGWGTVDADQPGARWTFELEPIAGTVRVRFKLALGPGASGTSARIDENPADSARILDERFAVHRANMERVLAGLEAEALAD